MLIFVKKTFLAFLLSLIAFPVYANTPQYHYNNDRQQRAIIESIYNEAIMYSNTSKCVIDVEASSEDNFIVFSRYVDVRISIIRNRKILMKYYQRVTQPDYIKFKYKLDNIIREYCK